MDEGDGLIYKKEECDMILKSEYVMIEIINCYVLFLILFC